MQYAVSNARKGWRNCVPIPEKRKFEVELEKEHKLSGLRLKSFEPKIW